MALTPTITLIGVTEKDHGMRLLTVNLKVNDGAADVIDRNFDTYHKTNMPKADILPRLREKMQPVIDAYLRCQELQTNPVVISGLTTLENSLDMGA